MNTTTLMNPFTPGAGHMPPHLAGRKQETKEFEQHLKQDTIFSNLILTGLRGVGKTVLLDHLRPLAIQERWLWVGTDLSESASISEEALAQRLITDLAVVTSSIIIQRSVKDGIGFKNIQEVVEHKLNYQTLLHLYQHIPGLAIDKLKGLLEIVWQCLPKNQIRGIIFAYDEAQILSDHGEKDQYPLSLLLDIFQSLQKKNIRFLLVLTGLPTLFPNLVGARTYSERMFKTLFLHRLNSEESREAIVEPLVKLKYPHFFTHEMIKTIIHESGGYPFFIQFICREIFDVLLQNPAIKKSGQLPIQEILMKLDKDFFSGRWARVTDRQRELLNVIAITIHEEEFTVKDVVESSNKKLKKPFSASHVNQMLNTLINSGLIYRNRHGKYSFAVPLLDRFILRQGYFSSFESPSSLKAFGLLKDKKGPKGVGFENRVRKKT